MKKADTDKVRDIAHSLRGEIREAQTELLFTAADDLDHYRARIADLEAELGEARAATLRRFRETVGLKAETAAAVRLAEQRWIAHKLSTVGDEGETVSCLCCGRVGERGAWSMEAPKHYVCVVCRDIVFRARSAGDAGGKANG